MSYNGRADDARCHYNGILRLYTGQFRPLRELEYKKRCVDVYARAEKGEGRKQRPALKQTRSTAAATLLKKHKNNHIAYELLCMEYGLDPEPEFNMDFIEDYVEQMTTQRTEQDSLRTRTLPKLVVNHTNNVQIDDTLDGDVPDLPDIPRSSYIAPIQFAGPRMAAPLPRISKANPRQSKLPKKARDKAEGYKASNGKKIKMPSPKSRLRVSKMMKERASMGAKPVFQIDPTRRPPKRRDKKPKPPSRKRPNFV